MGPKGHIQVIVPHLTESYGTKVKTCLSTSFSVIIDHVSGVLSLLVFPVLLCILLHSLVLTFHQIF